MNAQTTEEFRTVYSEYKTIIERRLLEFREVFENGSNEDIFYELMFCLFTPASNARQCWDSVCRIRDGRLLMRAKPEDYQKMMNGVRFHLTKSKRIVKVLEQFSENGEIVLKRRIQAFFDSGGTVRELRAKLVGEIDGFGWKEASHFLRNIGFGEDLAILDRHILRWMVGQGLIERQPESLNRNRYLELEMALEQAAKSIGIPIAHIDLAVLLIARGEVFK